MPRATWKGFLRLSLVSCPVYLTPAVTRTKSVRLHQVWVPNAEPESRVPHVKPAEPEREDEEVLRLRSRSTPSVAIPVGDREPTEEDEPEVAARISLRPHDPITGVEIERHELRKGYEYERGQFVTLTPDELKALDVESSRTIDLSTFVNRADVDPFYFNAPYYLYPDGSVAVEAYRVIAATMAEAGMAGLGRLTLSRREHMVLVESRGEGLALITLRSAEEVRAPEFGRYDTEIDPEAVAIATMIIKRKTGQFDPTVFRDRYQDALRELLEAKLKGRTLATKPAAVQPPVADVMAALKRSLAQEAGGPPVAKAKKKAAADRRQRSLLLPVSGDRSSTPSPSRKRPVSRKRA
jgi:DNA end-binding protein Ku